MSKFSQFGNQVNQNVSIRKPEGRIKEPEGVESEENRKKLFKNLRKILFKTLLDEVNWKKERCARHTVFEVA